MDLTSWGNTIDTLGQHSHKDLHERGPTYGVSPPIMIQARPTNETSAWFDILRGKGELGSLSLMTSKLKGALVRMGNYGKGMPFYL